MRCVPFNNGRRFIKWASRYYFIYGRTTGKGREAAPNCVIKCYLSSQYWVRLCGTTNCGVKKTEIRITADYEEHILQADYPGISTCRISQSTARRITLSEASVFILFGTFAGTFVNTSATKDQKCCRLFILQKADPLFVSSVLLRRMREHLE